MRAAFAAMTVLVAGALGTAGVASAEPAVPSAGELTSQLQTVLNTGAPTADNIANRLNTYGGMVNWQVQNPVLNGDQVDAQIAVTIPIFGTKTHDIYWVNQDGAWKLSNPSACVIATQVAGVDCTV